MKFTIDRGKWICGVPEKLRGEPVYGIKAHGQGRTALLNRDGFMCCLGQIAEQRGIDREHLLEEGYPSELRGDALPKIEGFLATFYEDPEEGFVHPETGQRGWVGNTALAERAMGINDAEGCILAEREKMLTELFAEYGHELEFVGEFTRDPNAPEKSAV